MPLGSHANQLITQLQVAGQAAYNASMGAAAASTSSVGTAADDTAGDVANMSRAEQAAAVAGQQYSASQAEGAVATEGMAAAASHARMALTAYLAVLAASGAALGGIGAAAWTATKRSNKFETAMTNIGVQAGYTEQQMEKVRKRIIGVDSALKPEEWAGAMAPFAYAGYEADQAWQAAEAAARASEAYMTDSKETAGALLKTMEAYNVEAEHSAYVMDVLAQAAASGTLEMRDLARYIPRVAASGAEAGASLEEMAGTLSAISYYAGSAERATGGLRTLYRSLATAGYEAQISQEGLLSVLQEVMKQTGGNRQALQDLLGSAEAVDAFLKIATGDFKKFRDALKRTGNAAGTVSKALAGRRDSMQNALDIVAQNMDKMKILIGDIIKLQKSDWVQALKITTTALRDYFQTALEGLRKEANQTRSTREMQIEMAKDLIGSLEKLGDALVTTGRIAGWHLNVYIVLAETMLSLALGFHETVLGIYKLKKALGRDVDTQGMKHAEESIDSLKGTMTDLKDVAVDVGFFSDTWKDMGKELDKITTGAREKVDEIADEVKQPPIEERESPISPVGEVEEGEEAAKKATAEKAKAEGEAADKADELAAEIEKERQWQESLNAELERQLAQTDDAIERRKLQAKFANEQLHSEKGLLELLKQNNAERAKIVDQQNKVTRAKAELINREKKLKKALKKRAKKNREIAREKEMARRKLAIVQAEMSGNLKQEITAQEELLALLEKRLKRKREKTEDPRERLRILKEVARQEQTVNRLREENQNNMIEGAERLKSEVNEIYNAYQKVIGGELGSHVADEIERLTTQTQEFRDRHQRQDTRISDVNRRNVRTIRLRLEGGSDEQAEDVGNVLMQSLKGTSNQGGGMPPK